VHKTQSSSKIRLETFKFGADAERCLLL